MCCVPPGNIVLWLGPHTAHPALTPGTIGHTPSLNVFMCMRESERQKERAELHYTSAATIPNVWVGFTSQWNAKVEVIKQPK